MSLVAKYLSEPTPSQEDFLEILKEVEEGANHVLGLVESLGPSLTSLDKETRASATQLLADVISNSKGLRRNDLEPLADFFCDRIKDHHSIVPHVLTAFSTLTGRSDLPDASAVSIAQSMFQHGEVQTLSQQHRATAFQTLVNLFHHKLEVLVMLRDSFTLGYIQMIDGEKDPRNLLTIFGLTQIVINNFPIGAYCEELFEVTACYFPVDFTPPPGASLQITRQQLADELRATLTSTHRFSQYCLPLLIEKISSDLQAAKQDSLQTLTDCCKVYNVEHLRPFTNIITQQLLREAMLSLSSRTKELALEAISAICSCLAKPVDGVTVYTDVDDFCISIIKECKHHLFEPEHDLVVSSVKVLQALLSSNQHAANFVLTDVMPVILERLNTGQQTKAKCVYLDMIRDLLSSSVGNVYSHKVSALDTVIEHMRHSEEAVCESALRCLAELADAAGSKLEEVSQPLLDMATNSESTALRNTSSLCLAALCKHNEEARDEVIYKALHSRLVEVQTLELSTLNILDAIVAQCSSDVCLYVLTQLLISFEQCPADNDVLTDGILSSILCALSSPLQLDSSILRSFMQTCFKIKLPEIADSTRMLMSDIIVQIVNFTDKSCLPSIAESSLTALNTLPYTVTAVQSVLCSLPHGVLDDTQLLDVFQPLTSQSPSPLMRLSACKICASVINKSAKTENLLKDILSVFDSPTANTLPLCLWTTKALVLRNHHLSQGCVSKVVSWLRNPMLSADVARGFEVILKDYRDVLSSKQNPNIRLMYKQRLFMLVFPALHEMSSSIEQELVANVHIAVTNLIKYIPKQVASTEKQKLMTLLVKLLQSEDIEVLQQTLQLIDADSDSGLLEQHVDTLLPILIKLSICSSSMQVRISSLKCLATMSKLTTLLIVPHMNSVIKKLLPALDDKKRLVRKEAVKTRNIWCMVRDGHESH